MYQSKNIATFAPIVVNMKKDILILSLLTLFMIACSGNKKVGLRNEDREVEKQLQGIWVDDDTESPLMRIKGDTIYYSDSQTAPVAFKVIEDTLFTYGSDTAAYKIDKHMDYILWLHSLTGDQLKLRKSEDPNDITAFMRKSTAIPVYTEQVKSDSVVIYKNIRYRAYTYINPSTKKVYCSSVSEDGFQVDNVYYDNVMHICVYQDARCLYGSDITKQMFRSLVPADFLEGSILSDMKFRGVGKNGFCYEATLQQPESYIQSLINLFISFDGKLSMKVVSR
jgi:hypothetical protein